MKKYILLAGVGFYFLTFMAIVGVAWMDIEESPDFHMVTNVITGERVKVFTYNELSQFRELEWSQTLRYPMAKGDLGAKEADNKPLFDKLAAWGQYQGSLYNVSADGEKIANAPNVWAGQEEYKSAACWHCHSQFVRPFEYENRRWGPTAQIGEASYESPHFFATRRVGPDLLREGGLRPDDWHFAHFYNPRFTVPQSIMAPFGGMSHFYVPLEGSRRTQIENEIVERFGSDPKRANAQDPGSAELTLMPFLVEVADEYKEEAWVLFKGRSGQTSADVTPTSYPVIRVAPRPTQKTIDLVAYVQSRGINIGTTGELVQKFETWAGDPNEANTEAALKYFRKKGFAAGNWRQQPAAAKPTGEPDYVFAPAIGEVLQKIVRGEQLKNKAEQDYMLDVDTARYRLKAWRQSTKRGADLFGRKCVGCHGGLEDNAYANERYTDYLVLSTDMEFLEPSNKAKFNLVGNGAGPAARFLTPEPRNLTLNAPLTDKGVPLPNVGYTTVYKYHSNTRDDLPLPRDLFHQIRNGMMPASMPAWPFLTDWEVWDLVNFVMYIGKNTTARTANAADMTPEQVEGSVKDFWSLPAVRESFANIQAIPAVPKKDEAGVDVTTVYLEKRGEELFKKKRNLKKKDGTDAGATQCVDCHGSEGDGWGGKRAEIISKMGFAARNFWQGNFKLGSSVDDIFLTLANGIAGTPMNAQNQGQNWSDLDAWALAYYVRKMARMGVTRLEEK